MRRVSLLVCVLALLAVAPAAQAATTIGQVFTPTASTSATLAQTGISTGAGYTVPSDGVITSWGFQSEAASATVRLKAVRANSDGSYSVVGESDPQTTTPNQLQNFSTRIPVRAGDYIGTAGSAGKTVAYTGANGDTVVLSPGDQPVGSSGNYSNVQGIRIDATASIEPDADADGFGDETQDLCPSDPTLQTKCLADLSAVVTVARKTVNPGGDVSFTVAIHNGGPSVSNAVVLRAEMSPELKLQGTSGAQCSGGPSITCQLGDVARDETANVTFAASAASVGIGTIAVQSAGSTSDANQANNSAGGSVFVVYHGGRCANSQTGTSGRNVLTGTIAGDVIAALDGNDIIGGRGGADCLSGGPGNDRISGDAGADTITGDDGDDILAGDAGNDRIDGGPGKDRISGGAGKDTLNGGSGDDSVNAIDGSRRDKVDCGAGRDDVARVDRGDRVRHCERVIYAKKKKR